MVARPYPGTQATYGSGAYSQLHDVLAHGRVEEEFAKVRLNRLHADAWKAWMKGGRATLETLGALLKVMNRPLPEVEAADDAQIRLAYGLPMGGAA